MTATGRGDPSVAAVVIGRNEGARLIACFASLRPAAAPGHMGPGPVVPDPAVSGDTLPERAVPNCTIPNAVPDAVPDRAVSQPIVPGRIVYVDSGSTDGSVQAARAAGAAVVVLDPARPFTAARARNAGLAALGAAGIARAGRAPDAGPTDTGPTDTGPTDTGPTDTGPTDAGPTDAGPTDAGPTDAGPTHVKAPIGRSTDFRTLDPQDIVDQNSGAQDSGARYSDIRHPGAQYSDIPAADVPKPDIGKPDAPASAAASGLATPAFVQFVDGDCTVRPDWIGTAAAFLAAHPAAAVACGRRRERHPETSAYNRLCDAEWDTPVGRTQACGGDALMRMAALEAVGGFDPALIAGEEPELCVRLRAAGWEIWRLDAEMTLHDAAMTRFGQFWARMRRGGHAAAEAVAMHGRAPERHGVAAVRRALFWGLALPLAILAGAVLTPVALVAFLIYPAQIVRLALRDGGGPETRKRAVWERAVLLTVGKFAETAGILGYVADRALRRRARLIEYK